MGFYIQDDMYEAVSELPQKTQDELLGAMTRFFFTGVEPAFKGEKKALFIAFKQRISMSRNNARRQKKWRNKSSDDNCDSNVTASTSSHNGAVSPLFIDGEGDREVITNVITNNPLTPFDVTVDGTEYANFYADALRIFNAETGQGVMDLTVSTMESLRRIHDNGRTPEDLRKVVSLKAGQWASDKKMRKYIRPSTLFGDKFEEYLGECEGVAREDARFSKYD